MVKYENAAGMPNMLNCFGCFRILFLRLGLL